MNKCLACAAVIVLLCCTASMRSQDNAAKTKPKEEPAAEKFTVKTELMEVRAVVTDRKGQIVENLKKEDFELLENDQPQEISFFSISNVESKKPQAAPAEAATQDKEAGIQRARERLIQPPARTTLLFVDSLHLSFPSLNRVKEALRRFVREQLTEQDTVALVTSGQTLGVVQQFTRDRQMLNYAIERIRLGPLKHEDIFTPTLAAEVLADHIEAVRMGVDIERQQHGIECDCDLLRTWARTDAQQILTEASYTRKATVSILKDFAEQMIHLPGKRMIVMFSDGFTLHDSDSGIHDEQLRPAIDRAVRSGVVIYSIDAKGVSTAPTIDVSRNVRRTNVEGYNRDPDLLPDMPLPAGMDPASSQAKEMQHNAKKAMLEGGEDAPYCPNDPHWKDPRCFVPRIDQWPTYLHQAEREEQNGLFAVADQTGGMLYTNHNDLNIPLGQALDANRFYYVLSYYLKAGSGDTKFRSIKVRVRNHPEYNVRTARGFAPAEVAAEAEVAKTPQQRLLQAMRAPLPVIDLGVSAQADFMEAGDDDKQVSLTVYFDGDRLQYREKDQHHVVGLEILYAVYDDSGKQVDGISANVEGTLTAERLEQARTSGFRFSRRLGLKPGVYQVRVGVREEGTDRMGTAAAWIEVPQMVRDKMEMSSLVLSNPLDTEPATKEGINVSELEQIRMVQGIPMYGREEFCAYSLRVYQGAPVPAGSDLQWMSELLLDGKPVKQEPWHSISAEEKKPDSKGWFDLDGEVALSGLKPGVYELRVSVKDTKSNKTVQRTTIFDVE